MGFILGIFKFFLFFFILGLIALAILLFSGVRMFKKMTGRQGQDSRQHRQTSGYRSTQTRDGVTIVDHRSPDEANKKIFAPDEGEYVDYTED